ncbi:MAG: PAS domain S-box protein, partial [Desulfomonile tiedjei]|nr:PAS domain S-box protein [Desulfomonile tiedjei]
MEDRPETTDQILSKLERLIARVAELEASEAEWRRAAEKFEAKARLMQSTIDSFPVLMSYVDSEQRYRFCSRTYEDWFGVPFGEIEGKSAREVLGESIYQTIRPHLESAISGNPVSYEFEWKFGDDKTREVRVNYVPHWEHDRIEGIAILVQDETERKAAARRLAEANEFNEKVLATSPLGITTFRSDGQCVLANEAIGAIIGATREQVLSQNFRELESWKKSGLLDEAEEVMSTGVQKRIDVHIFTAFGKDIWMNCRLNRFTSGNEHHLLMMVEDATEQRRAQDELCYAHEKLEQRVADRTRELISANKQLWDEISERKKIEEALRTSETMLKTILSTSPIGIGLAENRVMRWANEAWMKMFGFQHEQEFVGLDARIVYPSDEEYELVGRLQSESLETDRIISADATFRRTDGSIFDGNIRLKAFGTSESIRGTIAVISDISERKVAEQALKESERRYRALADNSLTGICVHNGRILLYVNDRFAETLGYSVGELIGKSPFEIISPEERDLVEARTNARLSGKDIPSQYEMRVVAKNGDVRCLDAWSTVIENNGGRAILVNMVDVTERKEFEKALRESEEKYRLLIENSPVGILSVTTDGEIMDVNKKLLEILGSPSAEATRKLNMLTFPLLVKAGISALVRRCMEEGHQISSELPYTTKWGKSLFLRVLLTPILDSTGNVTGCQAVMEDFTARRQAELSLAESEKKLRAIVEHSTNLFYSHTPDHILTYMSPQTRQFLDCEPWEAMTYWTDLISDNPVNAKGVEYTNRAITTGQVQPPYELELIGKTGRKIWVEVHESPVVVNGKTVAMVGSLTDITRRKRSESARRRLEAAVEQTAEAIVITDPKGIIQYVNPAFERISGSKRENVVRDKTSFLEDYQDDPAFCEQFLEILASGKNWSGRLSRTRSDDTTYQEDVTISPVRDGQGKIINYVAIKRDMSQEVALQQQLLQAQKMEAIGVLAGGIAHDFNNLLQVTLGFSELLLADKKETDSEYPDIQKIIQAAHNGADLVQRLLTFSRKVEPNIRPVKLNQRIKQLEKILGRTIPKMINIQLSLADDLATINADPTQMEQIIMNLAINARDAMPEGGELGLKTRNITLDEEFFRKHAGMKPGRFVLLEISDTGHGMDQD